MSKRSRSKGKYCAVYGCKSSSGDKVSLFLFPSAEKQPEIRKQWISFVKQKRLDFNKPSKYMCVCEKHFEDSCYPLKYRILKNMGKEGEITKKTLLPDSVPTINSSSEEIVDEEIASTSDNTSSCNPVPEVHGERKQKKARSAYRKRECLRIMQSYESEIASEATPSQHTCSANDDEHSISKVTRGTQLKSLKPSRRSVSSQTKPLLRSIDVQANFGIIMSVPKFLEDASVQCSMDYAERTDHDVIIYPSSAHPTTDSNLQVSVEETISDEEDFVYQDDSSDVDFSPSDTDSEKNTDIAGKNSSPYQEKKYIVFESQLLTLFTLCPTCHGSTTANIQQRVGSMISIHQECSCCYQRKWCSQPLIGNIPGGNLLMSASILFSGSTPTKALKLFDQMNVAAISRRTFASHQSMYLHPVVNQVWQTFQRQYFDEMRKKGYLSPLEEMAVLTPLVIVPNLTVIHFLI